MHVIVRLLPVHCPRWVSLWAKHQHALYLLWFCLAVGLLLNTQLSNKCFCFSPANCKSWNPWQSYNRQTKISKKLSGMVMRGNMAAVENSSTTHIGLNMTADAVCITLRCGLGNGTPWTCDVASRLFIYLFSHGLIFLSLCLRWCRDWCLAINQTSLSSCLL